MRDYSDNILLLAEFKRSGDVELRNRIIEANMGLVRHVAQKMTAYCSLSMDDLIQIGATGLIKAVERFDVNKNRKLSTLAIPFIQGAILQFLRDKSRLVKVPRKLQETHQRIKRHAQKHQITYEESAKKLGIPQDIAAEASLSFHQINLELPVALASKNLPENDAIELLSKLPKKDAEIIVKLYIEEVPPKAICQQYNITLATLKNIESKCISEMQAIARGRKKCSKCSTYNTVKNGKRGNKQSYLCRNCGIQFVDDPASPGRRGYQIDIKKKVIKAMAEGRSSYWCKQYLGIAHSTAHSWYSNRQKMI